MLNSITNNYGRRFIDEFPKRKLNIDTLKEFEHLLEDIMELTDSDIIKQKLKEVERDYSINNSELNTTRLGIIYHEIALNFSFLSESGYKGYAQKSFKVLTQLFESPRTTLELIPFIASYRASALSLIGAETKKLNLIGKSFSLFDDAVKKYSDISYLPLFLRGSVAENLPWFFFSKKKYATTDFNLIIQRQKLNQHYANDKIMSFTYWAWAKHHTEKKYRSKAIEYLDKAIALDPDYLAGRKKAEELKDELTNPHKGL